MMNDDYHYYLFIFIFILYIYISQVSLRARHFFSMLGDILLEKIFKVFLITLFMLRLYSFIHLLFNNVTCPSGCTMCSKGASHLFSFFLRDVPFRTHSVL
jgi:hypothetical protein